MMGKAFVLAGIILYLSLMSLRVASQENQSPKMANPKSESGQLQWQ
jgi:hypothetical protein